MSFDPFGDFETRGYLRNIFAEKDPAIVKRQEHHVFRLHIGEALDALSGRPSLSYQDILDTHQRLFGDYYPWAGQDRLAILPDVAVGKAGRYDLLPIPTMSGVRLNMVWRLHNSTAPCGTSLARSWVCSRMRIRFWMETEGVS